MFDMPASDPAFRTLAAAERILILSGEEALSARAIARETGLSTKVIYTYFKGMDGLVDVLRRSAINRFTQDLEAIGNSVAAQGNGVTDQDKKGNSVSGRLRAQIRHYIALAGMEPSRAMLLFAPDARNRTIRPEVIVLARTLSRALPAPALLQRAERTHRLAAALAHHHAAGGRPARFDLAEEVDAIAATALAP